MKFIGIDYSLSSPAKATIDTDQKTIECVFFSKKEHEDRFVQAGEWTFIFQQYAYSKWNSDQERYHQLADVICANISAYDKVAFEGYSFGSKGSSIYQIGENCGTAKQALWSRSIPFETIPPTSIKKAFSGSGKSNKDVMADAFKDKFGFAMHEFLEKKKADSNPASDIVDAVAIAWMLSQ